MNIFVLDTDPVVAAQMHCDKHVVKMVLETAQILSTVLANRPEWVGERVITPKDLYKPTHANHPAVKWAAECPGNFRWLAFLGEALYKEYRYRYRKVHKSSAVLDKILDFVKYSGSLFYIDMPMTPFAQCMPDEYKSDCAVYSYQQYYMGEKRGMASWKNRQQPKWWK